MRLERATIRLRIGSSAIELLRLMVVPVVVVSLLTSTSLPYFPLAVNPFLLQSLEHPAEVGFYFHELWH